MDKQQAVLDFIDQNFVVSEIKIEDCNLFPFAKRIFDKSDDEMMVYYDLLNDSVTWAFPDLQHD
jgi:hypothetical protein